MPESGASSQRKVRNVSNAPYQSSFPKERLWIGCTPTKLGNNTSFPYHPYVYFQGLTGATPEMHKIKRNFPSEGNICGAS